MFHDCIDRKLFLWKNPLYRNGNKFLGQHMRSLWLLLFLDLYTNRSIPGLRVHHLQN